MPSKERIEAAFCVDCTHSEGLTTEDVADHIASTLDQYCGYIEVLSVYDVMTEEVKLNTYKIRPFQASGIWGHTVYLKAKCVFDASIKYGFEHQEHSGQQVKELIITEVCSECHGEDCLCHRKEWHKQKGACGAIDPKSIHGSLPCYLDKGHTDPHEGHVIDSDGGGISNW